jgi:hypothetical protein
MTGWQRDALISCLMTVQRIDVAPNGWRRKAFILRLMVTQCLDIVPDGGTMLGYCA